MDAFCAGVLNNKYKTVNLVNSPSFTEESKLKVSIIDICVWLYA